MTTMIATPAIATQPIASRAIATLSGPATSAWMLRLTTRREAADPVGERPPANHEPSSPIRGRATSHRATALIDQPVTSRAPRERLGHPARRARPSTCRRARRPPRDWSAPSSPSCPTRRARVACTRPRPPSVPSSDGLRSAIHVPPVSLTGPMPTPPSRAMESCAAGVAVAAAVAANDQIESAVPPSSALVAPTTRRLAVRAANVPSRPEEEATERGASAPTVRPAISRRASARGATVSALIGRPCEPSRRPPRSSSMPRPSTADVGASATVVPSVAT